VGDDSEEGSWARVNGRSATAAANWLGGEECWDSQSEESEEECEFTDGEDEEFEFNENAFQKLFAGAYNTTGSVGESKGPRLLVHRYQHGLRTNIRTQQRTKKRAYEL
jgi:hypothetical protein